MAKKIVQILAIGITIALRLSISVTLAFVVIALAAAQGARASDGPGSDVVEMDKFIVEATRIDSRPWLYVALPEHEILSHCDAIVTERNARGIANEIVLAEQFVPSAYWAASPVPMSYILFDEKPDATALRPDAMRISDQTTLNITGGFYISDSDTHCAVQNLWGSDSDGGFDNPGAHSGGGVAGTAFRLRRSVPATPLWYQDGLIALMSGPQLPGGRGITLEAEDMTVAPFLWKSKADTRAILDAQRKAGARPVLPPVEDLFRANLGTDGIKAPEWIIDGGGSERVPSQEWLFEAALFLRWGIFEQEKGHFFRNKEPDHQRAFANFVARSRIEPLTEALFRDCFGFGYSEMQSRLAGYLTEASRDSFITKYPALTQWPPPRSNLNIRKATDSDIARLLGNWERMEGDSTRISNPEISHLFLEHANKTLHNSYAKGERDPRLLAALGLYDYDVGNTDEARSMLIAATNAGVARPAAYIDLARVNLDEAQRHPAAANGKVSIEQLASILKPLFATRKQGTLESSAYVLIANAWKQSSAKPELSNLGILDEGVSYYPFDAEVYLAAARTYATWDYIPQAKAIIDRGLPFVNQGSAKELLKLRSSLTTLKDTDVPVASPALPLNAPDNSIIPSDEVTAIYSQTFNGYIRPRRIDGSFSPETYCVAVGGLISGEPTAEEKGMAPSTGDSSIDHTTFSEVAGVLEQALAARHYIPTGDRNKATLLIMVYWGRTTGTNSFSGVMNGAARDEINQRNAVLLGFDAEGHLFDMGFKDTTNMMANIRRQVHSAALEALEDDRYIVILEAFDFQKILKEKMAVHLWETRFSLSQRHTDFRSGLPRMAQAAEHFFGTDSNGIAYGDTPEGHVEIGPLKSLGVLKEP